MWALPEMLEMINVIHICKVLKKARFEAWLVGGAVRDRIMGRQAHDLDIATNARPNQVMALFPHVVETGIEHGTVSVIMDGIPYEITTFRGEGKYSDGRRPDEIMFLDNIEEDLARRDFTINAIAWDPIDNIYKDPFGGCDDIQKKIIKAVGKPLERFSEDGLRVLRAARFAATLGFEIEENTLAAIRPTLDVFAKVAIERVQAEWFKIMMADKPSIAFKIMLDTGMLEITVPEFIPMVNCAQNKYHEHDVWKHTLETMDFCPKDPLLRLAALFHDVGKPQARAFDEDYTFYEHEHIGADITDNILTRMKFSTDDKKLIVSLVRNHYIRYQSDWGDAPIKRWVRKVGIENIDRLIILCKADILAKGNKSDKTILDLADEFLFRIKNMKDEIPTSTKILKIDGNDLIKLGIPQGKKIGEILSFLLEKITDEPELNTKDDLIRIVNEIYNRA
jgi:tRNA nucleotidyltransferase (CCA-adding enzyme)